MANNALIPNNNDPTSPFQLISFNNALKLTSTNYISWKVQLQAILFGYDLHKFVDGSHPCPPATLTVDDVISSNPAYQTWMRQDSLILGALMGTLSPEVLSLVSSAVTSREVWTILASTYANPSRGHILQVKNTLTNITKSPTQTVSSYMQSVKACVDQLAILGKPMDHEDVIEKILRGLDYETYKPVIHAVNARDTTISFVELHEKLINHELTIPSVHSVSAFPASVHAATYRPHRAPSNGALLPTPAAQPYVKRTSKPFLGKCQYCSTTGHVIAKCYAFKRDHPSVTFPNAQPTAPRAHVATVSAAPPNSWLLDSGASHHVTNDLSNLQVHAPYDGTDELIIGDGSSLPIANIGTQDGDVSFPRSF